jgi:hypothetical protein
MAFAKGQTVLIAQTSLSGRTGTIIEVRALDGVSWYQVGGSVPDNPEEVWNADFREAELEAV